jgi:phosphoribosylaminoimidazole-succinocarboxamide synthase
MKTFYSKLIEDLNAQMPEGKQWVDSSYGNDACGSVMFDPSEKYEDNFVQLFAFETQAEADAEKMTRYGVTFYKDGKPVFEDYGTVSETNDRREAVADAIAKAKKLKEPNRC